MKQQIRKISILTLMVITLYILGVFNDINLFSLLVIIPVFIAYIIIVVGIIKKALSKS